MPSKAEVAKYLIAKPIWNTIKALGLYGTVAGIPAVAAYRAGKHGDLGVPKGLHESVYRGHPLSKDKARGYGYGVGGGLVGGLAALRATKNPWLTAAGLIGGAIGGDYLKEQIHGPALTPEQFGYGAAYKPGSIPGLFAAHVRR